MSYLLDSSVVSELRKGERVHGLTLVTRNIKDVTRTGVSCLNPFTG